MTYTLKGNHFKKDTCKKYNKKLFEFMEVIFLNTRTRHFTKNNKSGRAVTREGP